MLRSTSNGGPSRSRPLLLVPAIASLVAALTALPAGAQTAFTYQGRLNDAGVPTNGAHDFRFRLFDTALNGAQVGSTLCVDNVAVLDGVFLAQIDFGAQFSTPAQRFLEIGVRRDTGLNCADATGFQTLSPRQLITAAPRAAHANSAFSLDAADGSPANVVFVDISGNVGVGTTTPAERLTVDGDLGIGAASSDYHHLRIGGGNSDGFLYGSFPHFGDGIHFGYNYFADAAGANHILQSAGGTSRLSMQYGAIVLATAPAFGGEPVNRLVVDSAGNVSIGNVLASGGVENLRIIRGVVSSDGTFENGVGFTVEHVSAGIYVIHYSTFFADAPAVTVTPESASSTLRVIAQTHESFANEVLIQIARTDGVFIDRPFSFISIGRR